MTDVFEEIAEDLRREKLNQFWKENGSWIVGGILLAVVMTGALSFWRQWEYTRDAKATAELTRVAALSDNAALETFAKDAPADQAMMARFIAASSYLSHGQKDKAIAAYDAIASATGTDKTYRHLAKIYSISLRADGGDAAALRKELAPLLSGKAVWRYSALELDALLAFRAGDKAAAVDDLAKISADPMAPADARARAFTLRSFYVAEKGETK